MKKPLIMIVDDIPRNIQILASFLDRENFEIVAATNSKESITMVKELNPDLILLDIMMPEKDGYSICKTLKSDNNTKEIPIIFMTAKSGSDDIIKGFEVGGNDYITKPFKPQELLARVKSQIKLREAQSKIFYLEKKNAALAMAITANHEINQPLMILQGNLEMLQMSLEKKKALKKEIAYINNMEKSINRIKNILSKFLNNHKIDFGEYAVSSEMVVFKDN